MPITCPQCGFTSHHPKDIAERYCGWCHQFHEDMSVRSVEAEDLMKMPAPDWAEEHMREQQRTIVEQGKTIEEMREKGALLVHALDVAGQLISALIAWTPEGQVLSPEVGGLKLQLDEVLRKVFGRPPP